MQESKPVRSLSLKEKALKLNLDTSIYGSFAEIGAGQEIASNFFKAGAASGTVAKTMSAYDMAFSDAIYGKSPRYVSRERLMTMLEHEYKLLVERLHSRITDTCFFVIADTVETLNYRRTNQGHGWMGLRFQLSPDSEPNEIILHMVLKDDDAVWQQQAVGILGVNLVYGAYFAKDEDEFLEILMEDLSPRRIEIDMLSFTGPALQKYDNRLLSLKLVRQGMTPVAMFGPDGQNVQASELLYKKNILAMRGRFRPVTHLNLEMLDKGTQEFIDEEDVDDQNIVTLWELTLHNLQAEGKIDERDFLDRVDILASLGQTVIISQYQEYYKLVKYLIQFSKGEKIGLVLGIKNLEMIFDEQYYQDLNGGILEAFGMLFGTNVKLFAYPALDANGKIYSGGQFRLPGELYSLFRYLYDNDKIEDILDIRKDLMHISSDHVLNMIRLGEAGWEQMVPPEVEVAVKEHGLFGYQPAQVNSSFN